MWRHACLLVACLGWCACADDVPPAPPPPPVPEPLLEVYAELRGHATSFAERDGEWLQDYGDAPFYGTGLYAQLGTSLGDDSLLAVANRARDYDVEIVRHANADRTWFLENMEEALMAALGLIEHASASGDVSTLPDLDTFIDQTNSLVQLFGDYLPSAAELGSFALETYGPTSITAAVALLNLQYAVNLDTPRRKERIDRAARLVRAIDRNAFDGDRYRFAPGEDTLFLYPNSMMMLVLCRLHALTGEAEYRDQAVRVAEALMPLFQAERGGYRSPYSAEYMGAETDDYSTLSSQNYLALAFLLLYEQTRDVRWFEEAIGVLDFIRTRLYDLEQGRLLHHWMDGRIAQPEDLEYFCSGCNFQYLYVLWYLTERVSNEG